MKLNKVQIPGDPVKFEVPGGLYSLEELVELVAVAKGQSERYQARELQGYDQPFGVYDIHAERWITEYGRYDMTSGRAFALAAGLNEKLRTR